MKDRVLRKLGLRKALLIAQVLMGIYSQSVHAASAESACPFQFGTINSKNVLKVVQAAQFRKLKEFPFREFFIGPPVSENLDEADLQRAKQAKVFGVKVRFKPSLRQEKAAEIIDKHGLTGYQVNENSGSVVYAVSVLDIDLAVLLLEDEVEKIESVSVEDSRDQDLNYYANQERNGVAVRRRLSMVFDNNKDALKTGDTLLHVESIDSVHESALLKGIKFQKLDRELKNRLIHALVEGVVNWNIPALTVEIEFNKLTAEELKVLMYYFQGYIPAAPNSSNRRTFTINYDTARNLPPMTPGIAMRLSTMPHVLGLKFHYNYGR